MPARAGARSSSSLTPGGAAPYPPRSLCRSQHTQRVILASLSAAVKTRGCAALVALNQPHHLPAFDRVVHLDAGKVQAAARGPSGPEGSQAALRGHRGAP